jgi:TolB protein
VFTTNRDGDNEIARINADGTGFELLTANSWEDNFPTWSHDGGLIAWYSRPTGTGEVYVMNADGSAPHAISDGDADNLATAWSPVGDRLAFVTGRDGNSEIYAVDASGAGLGNLTQNGASDLSPAWAPDGSMVVFSRDNQVFVMNSDGANQTLIRDEGSKPRWSPSGTYIAYLTALGLARSGTTGTGELVLYTGPTASFEWSPDGSMIAFCSRPTISTTYLHTVTSVGEAPVQLTTGGVDCDPHWSPDGTRIVFVSRRDGNSEIYVANADGTELVNLTMDLGDDINPAWAACP